MMLNFTIILRYRYRIVFPKNKNSSTTKNLKNLFIQIFGLISLKNVFN